MRTILVVDDSTREREMVGACVETLGVRPIYAGDGRSALKVLENTCPDCVLTALRLLDMDILELVRQIRARYPAVPVILMTANGLEGDAARAFRGGATSYVPKRDLCRGLGAALEQVRYASESVGRGSRVRGLLERSEAHYVLAYDDESYRALIGHLQETLARLDFGDETERMQIATALTEALANARDHGNLELSSTLREQSDSTYAQLRAQRIQDREYGDRRVYVTVHLGPEEAVFVVRDEGPGFDAATLPNPTDSENLLKLSGRGIMLIRYFMDEVRFDPKGNEITMVKRRPIS